MGVILCIPTLNNYDGLLECADSALSNKSLDSIYIIDNGNGLQHHFYDKITVESFNRNIGVPASWNLFINKFIDESAILISNDDIIFNSDDIDKFYEEYLKDNHDFYYAMSNKISGNNKFSCFMPTKNLINTIGLFDERFYPAYYEDNDYQYRMDMANIKELGINGNILHGGSRTISNYSEPELKEHHLSFLKNKKYYINKWGGHVGNEIHTTPFNK